MSHYSLQLIEDKSEWESFILSDPKANFLQSWNWGVFQERMGKKVFRIAIKENGRIVAAAECVKEEAKRGTYLTIAGGPLMDWANSALVKFLFDEISKYAKTEKCIFIRIRPQEIDSPQLRQLMSQLGFKEAPMHLTADLTVQLDLTKSEEELLAEMRKNTRYDVRKAERDGITVRASTNPAEIQTFYEHQLVLAKKHGFVPFSYEFLYEQFRTLVEDQQAILFHSYKDEQLLASAFIIFYNGEAVYHYGISTPPNERLPGSYACQWASIRWAKEHGGRKYNFWGIAPADQPNHRFAGVTTFKKGFGGEEVQYLPAHDLPLSIQYHVTSGFEKVRRKLRRL
jgi:lipid II:glycine glycyltransferase (peptidoglycan interpeptide bridge formation enzyme)